MSSRVTQADGSGFWIQGMEHSPAEFDPFGGNVGIRNPYTGQGSPNEPPPELQNSRGQAYEDSDNHIAGQRRTCQMDGMRVPCSTTERAMENDAAIPASIAQHQSKPGFQYQSRGFGIYTYEYFDSSSERMVNGSMFGSGRIGQQTEPLRTQTPDNPVGGGGSCIASAVTGGKLASDRIFQLTNGVVTHDGWHVRAPVGSKVKTLKELQGTVLRAKSQEPGLNYADVYVKGVGIAIYKDLGAMSVKKGDTVTKDTIIGEIGSKGENDGLHFALFVGTRAEYQQYRNITGQIGDLKTKQDALWDLKLSIAQTLDRGEQIESKITALRHAIKKEWFANDLKNTPVGNCPPNVPANGK